MTTLKGKIKRDLTGMRFGRLTVLPIHITENRATKWLCRCDCGNEKYIYRGTLLAGQSNSCGCLRKEKSRETLEGNALSVTHGKSYSRTYHIWLGMKQRCFNPRNKKYSRYGGRGITVCERWLSFENFLEDMGEVPGDLTIDRIDNDGNYEPGNCRWITTREQFATRSHTSTQAHKEACRENQKKALEALRKKRGK